MSCYVVNLISVKDCQIWRGSGYKNFNVCKTSVTYNTQLFRQRLSHKSVKAYATMPIGIMGRTSLAFIDWSSLVFTNRKREGIHTFGSALSLYVAKKPKASINDQEPVIPFGIVAYAFVGQPFSKQLYLNKFKLHGVNLLSKSIKSNWFLLGCHFSVESFKYAF